MQIDVYDTPGGRNNPILIDWPWLYTDNTVLISE